MAEPGISCQLEGKAFGLVMQHAAVKCADTKDQSPDQRLEFRIRRFVFGLVGVIPFPVIVPAQIGEII